MMRSSARRHEEMGKFARLASAVTHLYLAHFTDLVDDVTNSDVVRKV